jgi:hypothetical protein
MRTPIERSLSFISGSGCAMLALFVVACAASPPRPAALPPPQPPPSSSPPPSSRVAAGDDLSPELLAAAGVDVARLRCNRDNRWGASLRADAEAGSADLMAQIAPHLDALTDGARAELQRSLRRVLFWRMVRAVLVEGDNNNLGVVPLQGRTWVDADGRRRPVLIFRSGVTPAPDAPDSCFRSLLEAGGVRHVVNLFDGEIPIADLAAAESRAATAAGASYATAGDEGPGGYGRWRDDLRSGGADARCRAEDAVARLVREQILRPGGAPPRGNLHVHCGGGMHRTGMVVGVIERCVNGEPPDVVEAHYRRHVGWRDAAHPGGLEEDNLRFIREFDCALLSTP